MEPIKRTDHATDSPRPLKPVSKPDDAKTEKVAHQQPNPKTKNIGFRV